MKPQEPKYQEGWETFISVPFPCRVWLAEGLTVREFTEPQPPKAFCIYQPATPCIQATVISQTDGPYIQVKYGKLHLVVDEREIAMTN